VNVHPAPAVSAPSVKVAVNPVEQLSVTLAVPNAAAICAADGLQGNAVDGVTVITGSVRSTVQVTVRLTGVAAFPQISVTFQVRVCEYVQPTLETAPSVNAGEPTLQLSVAVAVPSAALMVAASGLQPSVKPVPVAEITGLVISVMENGWLHVLVHPFKLMVSDSV
jgi:hypothetical protein